MAASGKAFWAKEEPLVCTTCTRSPSAGPSISARDRAAGTSGLVGTTQVPLNEWVHCVVVVDGAHLYYFNGQPGGVAGQGAVVPTGGSANLTIGQTGENNFFLGMIDEVRLYDVALTAAEVKALFQGVVPTWPKAKAPNPAHEAVGVLTPLFQWEAGDGATLHTMYLGTSPDLTAANLVRPASPLNMYYHVAGLESGVTYYWRVDETTAGGVVTTGDVWSFTAAPVEAYLPNPADGARNVLLDSQLAWSPAAGAVSHDVYFGTNREDVAAGTGGTFKGNQFGLTFDPGPLAGDTTYYWRIDENKAGTQGQGRRLELQDAAHDPDFRSEPHGLVEAGRREPEPSRWIPPAGATTAR